MPLVEQLAVSGADGDCVLETCVLTETVTVPPYEFCDAFFLPYPFIIPHLRFGYLRRFAYSLKRVSFYIMSSALFRLKTA